MEILHIFPRYVDFLELDFIKFLILKQREKCRPRRCIRTFENFPASWRRYFVQIFPPKTKKERMIREFQFELRYVRNFVSLSRRSSTRNEQQTSTNGGCLWIHHRWNWIKIPGESGIFLSLFPHFLRNASQLRWGGGEYFLACRIRYSIRRTR